MVYSYCAYCVLSLEYSWLWYTLMKVTCWSFTIPCSGLFPWGANFRYFRGSPRCHEIFHPRNFPPTKFSTHEIFHPRYFPHLRSAVCTCSNLDQRRFVTAFFSLLVPQFTVSLIHRLPFLKLSRVLWLRKWTEQCRKQKPGQQKAGPVPLVNAEEPKVASWQYGEARHHSKRISTIAILALA